MNSRMQSTITTALIVTSYAENIKNNVDELHDPSITFMNPFLALTSEEIVHKKTD